MRSNGVVLNLGVYQDRQQNRGVAAEIVNIGPPSLHLSNEDNTLGNFVFCWHANKWPGIFKCSWNYFENFGSFVFVEDPPTHLAPFKKWNIRVLF